MASNTTPILIKFDHVQGIAVIDIDKILSMNYERQLSVMTIYMSFETLQFFVDEKTFLDIYTKWKKYKDEMKEMILSQFTDVE